MQINEKFWKHLQILVDESKITIDRPKGSRHPKFTAVVYEVDYGFLENTSSMDGQHLKFIEYAAARDISLLKKKAAKYSCPVVYVDGTENYNDIEIKIKEQLYGKT